jgi:hypothetical protein
MGPLALLALLLCAPVACGDEGPTAVESPFSGTWALEAVDGAALPRVVAGPLLGGEVRYLGGARLVVRTRGRVDDIRSFYWERRDGTRFDERTDTVTVPYALDDSLLSLRRFALSGDDWSDDGIISDGSFGTLLTLSVRYADDTPFGVPDDVTFRYRRVE